MCEEGLTRMKDTGAWPHLQRQQGLSEAVKMGTNRIILESAS